MIKELEVLKKDLYFYKHQVEALKQNEVLQKNETNQFIKKFQSERKEMEIEDLNILREMIQIRDQQNQDLMSSNFKLNTELAQERLRNLELNQKNQEL